MCFQALAVVAILRAIIGRVDLACRSQQGQEIVFRIFTGEMCQFVNKAADRECMVNIAHRSQPADAYVGFCIARFKAHIRYCIGVINKTEPQFEAAGSG